jgi:hypothetical protein
MILGGAEGTRTPDPHTASVVRYQLRHSPVPGPAGRLGRAYMPPTGDSHEGDTPGP